MKYKSFLTVETPDAIAAADRMRKTAGIMAANAITINELRIKYDARKITPKQILSILTLSHDKLKTAVG